MCRLLQFSILLKSIKILVIGLPCNNILDEMLGLYWKKLKTNRKLIVSPKLQKLLLTPFWIQQVQRALRPTKWLCKQNSLQKIFDIWKEKNRNFRLEFKHKHLKKGLTPGKGFYLRTKVSSFCSEMLVKKRFGAKRMQHLIQRILFLQ